MIDDDSYLDAVSEAFKKLSEAQTQEELKEILANWPSREKYTVENVPEFTKEEMEDMGYEIENFQE